MIQKRKIDKLDLNKIRNFCSKKPQNSIKRKKKQATTDWEKIFANLMSNKGLLTRIYKKIPNSTVKK